MSANRERSPGLGADDVAAEFFLSAHAGEVLYVVNPNTPAQKQKDSNIKVVTRLDATGEEVDVLESLDSFLQVSTTQTLEERRKKAQENRNQTSGAMSPITRLRTVRSRI